jgi:heme oxygenase
MNTTVSLADTLKDSTRDAHSRAERHPIQGALARGTVSLPLYTSWLSQMFHLWSAIDAGVESAARRDPRVRSMHRPHHPHAHRIADDLDFLRSPITPPLPATREAMSRVEQSSADASIIGVWYVLEGSANGGRFLAKSVARALNIAGARGLSGLDPHGERMRDFWMDWRASLDAQEFSPAERDAIQRAAEQTFNAVYDIMEDIQQNAC